MEDNIFFINTHWEAKNEDLVAFYEQELAPKSKLKVLLTIYIICYSKLVFIIINDICTIIWINIIEYIF